MRDEYETGETKKQTWGDGSGVFNLKIPRGVYFEALGGGRGGGERGGEGVEGVTPTFPRNRLASQGTETPFTT
jgi:hypothetical protein